MTRLFEKQHPRDKRVRKAQEEINIALGEIFNKYELSYGEVFGIISEYMNICSAVMMDRERTDINLKGMCPVCGETTESCKCGDAEN